MNCVADVASAIPPKISVGAVIVCAGKGTRTRLKYNKILYNLGQKTVLETVLDKFASTPITQIVLVVAHEDAEKVQNLVEPYDNVSICYGGVTRTESVKNGLNAMNPCDIVVIHDGARPFVKPETIVESIASAYKYGSGIVAVPTVDTVKQVQSMQVIRSLDRNELYNVQTPQAFRFEEIVNAYQTVSGVFTDDSEVYERAGYTPRVVLGEYENIKITNETDLTCTVDNVKIGIGYDVHRLVDGRPLILGGVSVAHKKGLLGHSDADVLTHAVMDALLSAAGLPDIGVLFPDNDQKLSGVSSMLLLDNVLSKLQNCGMTVGNVSAVIIAEEPKMAPHISDIRKNLATRMNIPVDRVNISATTTENLGVIAGGEAIACNASCLLTQKNGKNQTEKTA